MLGFKLNRTSLAQMCRRPAAPGLLIAIGIAAILVTVVVAQINGRGEARAFEATLTVMEGDGNGNGTPWEFNKDTFYVQGPLFEDGVEVGFFQCEGVNTDPESPDDAFGNVGGTFANQRFAISGEGEIMGVGAEADGVTTMAVVGGTGRFLGITGSYTIEMVPDTDPPQAQFAMHLLEQSDVRDFSNVFFVQLGAGLNMISLPLEPIAPQSARSLAAELSATTVIEYDETARRFVGFTPDAPNDGFAIEGGKGYIVNTPAGGAFAFTGAAWRNEPPLAAPPLATENSAWAFVVSGWALDSEVMSARDGDYTVIAKNLRTGAMISEAVDSSGYFAAAWADLSRRAVIEAGDRIEVSVIDSSGNIVSGPSVHEITLDGIRDALVNVQLRLGSVMPEKSALLQNYPNPFNPETWIPFRLKDADSVSIKLYDATGGLVRTLDLGHKDAGVYISRSSAAYWDGKNESGEEVASGIYFYSITAGDFSATRKMVVKK